MALLQEVEISHSKISNLEKLLNSYKANNPLNSPLSDLSDLSIPDNPARVIERLKLQNNDKNDEILKLRDQLAAHDRRFFNLGSLSNNL